MAGNYGEFSRLGGLGMHEMERGATVAIGTMYYDIMSPVPTSSYVCLDV